MYVATINSYEQTALLTQRRRRQLVRERQVVKNDANQHYTGSRSHRKQRSLPPSPSRTPRVLCEQNTLEQLPRAGGQRALEQAGAVSDEV